MNQTDNEHLLHASMIPKGWTVCFLSQCPLSNECLRYAAAKVLPTATMEGYAIYPSALNYSPCPLYKPIQVVRMAFGFRKIFTNVKLKDSAVLHKKIKSYLGGNGSYYDFHHGRRKLSPKQQTWIIQLMRRYGYTENLEFDYYEDIVAF